VVHVLRTLSFKGDISKIEVIFRKGGNIIRHREIGKRAKRLYQGLSTTLHRKTLFHF